MSPSLAIIVALAALLTMLNRKLLRWPSTVGLMFLSLVLSLLVIVLKPLVPELYTFLCSVVADVDFQVLLMDVMLSFLLFAGAMHIDIRKLHQQQRVVLVFATLGVLLSTLLVGAGLYGIVLLLGSPLSFLHCLLFGALISPTDPVAVLAILGKMGVSDSLLLKVEGESLFNDGVGVIVFMTILSVVESGDQAIHWGEVGRSLLQEAGGGLLLGAIFGWSGIRLMRWTREDVQSNLMITLAITVSGYAVAGMLQASGPLAMVVAGLWIGNRLRDPGFPKSTHDTLNLVWQMLDDVLNAILFVLIGLVVHTIVFSWANLWLGLSAVAVVLMARFISVALPYQLIHGSDHHPGNTIRMLTWGGLRGGISIALAMSLGDLPIAEPLLFITYIVVLFSILIQGNTINKLSTPAM